jgi:hypothetical protein
MKEDLDLIWGRFREGGLIYNPNEKSEKMEEALSKAEAKTKSLNQKIILYIFFFGYEGATGQPTDSRAGPWPEKISRVEIVMPSALAVRKHIGTV